MSTTARPAEGARFRDPPPRAHYHHGDLRRALIDVTLDLLSERGPEAFSLREAARRVGVTAAAAYRHFAHKEALLRAVAESGAKALRAEMAAAARGRASSRVAPLLAASLAYLRFAKHRPAQFRLMFEQFGIPSAKARRVPLEPSPRELYGQILDELVSAGKLSPQGRSRAEVLVWSAVHGLSSLIASGALPIESEAELELLGEQLTSSLLCGLDHAKHP